MSERSRQLLTADRLIRLSELSPDDFELLLLHFLCSRPLLTVNRSGKPVSARVIEASTYARTGHSQQGIDIKATMEGGETWAFQCKRVRSWDDLKTKKAIIEATFAANHYVLVLACNPPGNVHHEIAKHANWTLWNLDTTCTEIRLRTPPESLPRILPFLSPDELKRFTPFASTALVSRDQFFAGRLGSEQLFRHDWDLVGRAEELAKLETLLKPDGRRGAVIYSKGGDGKSRLLLEFARIADRKRIPVVFLNPNGSADALDFSFLRDDAQFVIVVDDAHRPDHRHLPLMRLVEQEKRARLLFATRPQGFEPLLARLIETGLREEFDEFALPPLRTPEIRRLAEQALGAERPDFADPLTQLTQDSAFLTVLAGGLIRLGKLGPGQWASDQDFRLRVFKAFEEENLRDLSSGQETLGARLLRIIALLAPTSLDESFAKNAAVSLDAKALDVADEIQRLRRIGLLTESQDDGRIVPDLFADFLAYDVAVDAQRRQPLLVSAVREAFPEATSAMLRNLAEAAWVGGPPTSDVDVMLAPLVATEFERFRGLSFYRRGAFLDAWSGFGIYLPSQTIDLAKLALSGQPVPKREPDGMGIFPVSEQMDCHRFVLEKVPSLLEPIAQYHHKHRTAALDALWELGKLGPLQHILGLGPNAWEKIGQVLKPHASKPVEVCLEGLDWLEQKLSIPTERALLSDNFGILRSVLAGCFVRHFEFYRQRGATFSWWEQAVPMECTARIRQRALKILTTIIEQADWRAAVGVLHVLNDSTRGVGKNQGSVDDANTLCAEWREERLAGLDLLRSVVSRHPKWAAIRYLVRTQLLHLVRYEEDAIFKDACRSAITEIPDDLALRMSRALLSQGYFDEGRHALSEGSTDWDRIRRRWETKCEEIFEEFRHAHPDAGELLASITNLDAHLRSADCHPPWSGFFSHLAKLDATAAMTIATRLVETAALTPPAGAWTALIDSSAYGSVRVIALQRRALEQTGTEAARSAVTWLINRRDPQPPLTAGERNLLLEAASRAQTPEVATFIQPLSHGFLADKSLAREIIARLPADASKHVRAELFLQILCAYCLEDGRDIAFVRTVLGKLVTVPDLDLDLTSHFDAHHLLTKQYPRELLDFLRTRVEFQSGEQAPDNFQAIPSFRPLWLDSAKLRTAPDFDQLREDVWRKAVVGSDRSDQWLRLFQTFALDDTAWFVPRLLNEIENATTLERLHWMTRFLSFRGSLLVFSQTEITRRFLTRALELGHYDQIRAALYVATGPQSSGWSNGKLNTMDDYVEAEASKAAERHQHDVDLYPFFRWIVEIEQSKKTRARTEHELRMLEIAT